MATLRTAYGYDIDVPDDVADGITPKPTLAMADLPAPALEYAPRPSIFAPEVGATAEAPVRIVGVGGPVGAKPPAEQPRQDVGPTPAVPPAAPAQAQPPNGALTVAARGGEPVEVGVEESPETKDFVENARKIRDSKGVYVAPSWSPDKARHERVPISKEADERNFALLGSELNIRNEAAKQTAEANETFRTSAAVAINDFREKIADAHEREVAESTEQQKRMERAMQRALTTERDYEDKAAKGVDPNDYYKRLDDKGGIFAGLALMFAQGAGAYGATLQRTENHAAKALDKAVNDNINGQLSNLKELEQRAKTSREAADTLKKFGDTIPERRATAIARAKLEADMALERAGALFKKGMNSPEFLDARAKVLDMFREKLWEAEKLKAGTYTNEDKYHRGGLQGAPTVAERLAANAQVGSAGAHKEANAVKVGAVKPAGRDGRGAADISPSERLFITKTAEARKNMAEFDEILALTRGMSAVEYAAAMNPDAVPDGALSAQQVTLRHMAKAAANSYIKDTSGVAVNSAEERRTKAALPSNLSRDAAISTFESIRHELASGVSRFAGGIHPTRVRELEDNERAYLEAHDAKSAAPAAPARPGAPR